MNIYPNHKPDPLIILFDGECNLCNGSVQFIIKRDRKGRFRFASMQSPEGSRLMEAHGLDPEKNAGSFVLIEGERVLTKSDAALRVGRELSGFWPLLDVFRLAPRSLRDLGYDMVARNRYAWFGRTKSCMVPSKDLKNRFLD